MNDWFKEIWSSCELAADALRELLDSGFVVIPGPVASERLAQFAQAYDLAVAGAVPPDLSVGSETTRVHDFVNRRAEFDELYVYRPVLEACCRVIGEPFKLSSAHCLPEPSGHAHRHSLFMWTSGRTRMGGRWSVSSLWWTTFEIIMGPLVLCLARTKGFMYPTSVDLSLRSA
ncbi:MAG TPA: hypothetical protein VF544_21225 [Pyrinomonadaceae bacterium]|jgi:hypothetical protein